MTAESVFIAKVLTNGDVVSPLNAGITSQFFAEERGQRAWSWIYKYWTDHSQCPSVEAFKRRFPTYDLTPSDDPLSGLIEEVREAHKFRLTQDGLSTAITVFDSTEDPDQALESLQQLLSRIATDVSSTDIERSQDFIGDHVIKITSENRDMSGLRTGFRLIDESLGGIRPEQLVCLIGAPKRGKSTIALAVAMHAEMHGRVALVISFEMSNDEQKDRYVCLGAHVSLNNVMGIGTLTDRERDRIDSFYEEVLEYEGSLTLAHDVSNTLTVGGIAAKIEQHSPDLVVVDGVYMMHDELGEKTGSPQALTNISRGLKRLAQAKRVPIFMTTQALLNKMSKSRGTDMESIGYTSAFAQDADVIMGIDRDDLTSNRAKLKVIAARNALGREVDLEIDLDRGTITEMESYDLETESMTSTDWTD